MTTKISLREIECITAIGAFDWEQQIRQKLLVDLNIEALILEAYTTDRLEDTVNYKEITDNIIDHARSGQFQLLERLAYELAQLVIDYDKRIVKASITIHKPGALGVIARDVQLSTELTRHQLIIGIGSNIEPKKNIDHAIKLLTTSFGNNLGKASLLTTKAIGQSNAPDYINTAVHLTTSLKQSVLERRLKHIEDEVNQSSREGSLSRAVDLDLLSWNDTVIDADLFTRDYLQQLVEELHPEMLQHLKRQQPRH